MNFGDFLKPNVGLAMGNMVHKTKVLPTIFPIETVSCVWKYSLQRGFRVKVQDMSFDKGCTCSLEEVLRRSKIDLEAA